MNVISYLSDFVWGWPSQLPLIVVLLVGTGVITTFRLGWIQVRYFRHGVRVIRGEYDDPDHQGDLSHFQALTTALSATVGIGNIAGVATAIHYGGPGALFWMWVTAVFGMALKYWAFSASFIAYRKYRLPKTIFFNFGCSNLLVAILFSCYLLIT